MILVHKQGALAADKTKLQESLGNIYSVQDFVVKSSEDEAVLRDCIKALGEEMIDTMYGVGSSDALEGAKKDLKDAIVELTEDRQSELPVSKYLAAGYISKVQNSIRSALGKSEQLGLLD